MKAASPHVGFCYQVRALYCILLSGLCSRCSPHSSSAFGIKSQAPASASLFGQSTAAKPSIFGSTQPTTGFGASTQPQAQGSIFGGGQQQAGAPSTGLFGQPAGQQQNQQPASTGLFGQPAASTQQQPASTGLFGQPAAQQQPASTGLFGQPAAQQQPASTGLFGQPAAATQQQPQSNLFGSSLFGSTNTANQTTQQQGQGLFGSTNNQQQQQQQPNQPTFGGWGSTAGNTNALQPQATLPAGSNAWGSSLLGQQNKPQTYVTSSTTLANFADVMSNNCHMSPVNLTCF